MLDRTIFGRHSQFTRAEHAALQVLRTQYMSPRPRFTDRELAHLRFMHWLVHRPDWNRALDQLAIAQVMA